MSSIKRYGEETGLLTPYDQLEHDIYYDGDEKIGYRLPDFEEVIIPKDQGDEHSPAIPTED